jgi:hypothetical protein
MARRVADLLWDMLAKAGVQRCYGTLSLAKQALSGKLDAVIKTVAGNTKLL